MPSISGLEAARRIKAKEELRHIPIVALTSFALSGDDKKAFAAGCDAYLAKPYKPRELLKLIERAAGETGVTTLEPKRVRARWRRRGRRGGSRNRDRPPRPSVVDWRDVGRSTM